ncbi:phage capsid protein [Novosphingobium colocasiae]|uniref:phage capsid protein n=1 Tax=Novosphingobium colocasiae TaxID=1256513 RepID=UPI0035AD806F
MSVENTAQVKFQNNLEMALQLQSSPLEEAVTVQDDASAEKIKIKDIAGNKSPQEDDERGGNTKWNNTTYDGVWLAKPNELYDAEIIENSDKLATAIDLNGAAVMSGRGVINRAKTQRILEGFFGPVISGKTGTVTTNFPAGNYVAVDVGAAAAAKMNTAKLRAATKMLTQAFVPDEAERFMLLTADDNDALLTEIPATSEDFKGAFGGVFVNGKIQSMLGWKFIHIELDNPLLNTVPALATDGSGYRLNPFWVKPGVVLNFWQRLRSEVGKIPEKRFMPGYLAGTTCAATRTQPGMSGIIRNLKG